MQTKSPQSSGGSFRCENSECVSFSLNLVVCLTRWRACRCAAVRYCESLHDSSSAETPNDAGSAGEPCSCQASHIRLALFPSPLTFAIRKCISVVDLDILLRKIQSLNTTIDSMTRNITIREKLRRENTEFRVSELEQCFRECSCLP
jgi:hypothetical protein